MSEKSDPRARLVAEAFHDDWNTGPASAFARAAAAHARRRRLARRAFVGGAATAAVFLVVFTLASRRAPATNPLPPPSTPIALSTKTSPAFEIISDEELFAALRTRPLLILPEEPADRRYVVLAPGNTLAGSPERHP